MANHHMSALDAGPKRSEHDHDYSALLHHVYDSFESTKGQLFRTNAEGLFELYLDRLPAERQIHNCNACKNFITRFGGLVRIDEIGFTIPVMWDPDGVPEFYHGVFESLYERVSEARVTSAFFCSESVLGTPVTGEWRHISVRQPTTAVYRQRAMTAEQAMAANKERYRTVVTALRDFTPEMLDEALRVLEADALHRSEKFVGPVKWLRSLHDRPKGKAGENVLWAAVTAAPEGYCHPRASVIGSLLEDLAAGYRFVDLRRRFNAKVGATVYQRPQVGPTAGNLRAAEALVQKLGVRDSLDRRFARLEEVVGHAVWSTRDPGSTDDGSVFGHIKPKARGRARSIKPMNLPIQTMTWEKFKRTVLPTADNIQINVPGHGHFLGVVTATHADAPPILKWDHEEERNPFSWYVYPGGSRASRWNLTVGRWTPVNAVLPFPTLWDAERAMPHLADGDIILIEGARDIQHSGSSLFPEILKDELHGIRASVEAYSKSVDASGAASASACGLDVRRGMRTLNISLRVTSRGATAEYLIDRFD